jgi:hypothetical protein
MMALQRKIKRLRATMNANNRRVAAEQAYLRRAFKPSPAMIALMMIGGFAAGYLFARKKRFSQVVGASIGVLSTAQKLKHGLHLLPFTFL